jgi:hypothetical protein
MSTFIVRSLGATVISSSPPGPAHPSPAAGQPHTVALAVIGLAVAAHMARDRRNYERVILAALAVAAVAGLGHTGRVHFTERLLAWDKKRPWPDNAGPKRKRGAR